MYRLNSLAKQSSASLGCVIMVHSIKLFRWIRNIHRMTGIYPLSKSKQNFLLNFIKRFIVLVSLMILFVTSTAFALFEARSTAEYATSSSTSIMMFINEVFYLINMMKMKNIIELIRKFEDFIEMSKHLRRKFRFEQSFSLQLVQLIILLSIQEWKIIIE